MTWKPAHAPGNRYFQFLQVSSIVFTSRALLTRRSEVSGTMKNGRPLMTAITEPPGHSVTRLGRWAHLSSCLFHRHKLFSGLPEECCSHMLYSHESPKPPHYGIKLLLRVQGCKVGQQDANYQPCCGISLKQDHTLFSSPPTSTTSRVSAQEGHRAFTSIPAQHIPL